MLLQLITLKILCVGETRLLIIFTGCEFNEDDKRRFAEVLRIKGILEKHGDCRSGSVVYDSLKKLLKMRLSIKVVDATWIGNIVSRLQDHAFKEGKHTANMIIGSWMHRSMFDIWVDSNEKMPAFHQERNKVLIM